MRLRLKQSLQSLKAITMKKIKDLRFKIDEIDEKLFDVIVERMNLVKEIGKIKKINGLGIVDKDRETEIINQLKTKSNKKGINSDLVKKIWKILMEMSYEIEGVKNGNS